MGYSRNPEVLERIIDSLEPLTRGQECLWERPTGDAIRWADRIREALYIADHHPHRYPELAAARGRFIIKTMSDNEVRAIRRQTIDPSPAIINGTERPPSTMVDLSTVLDRFGKVIADIVDLPMHFSHTTLSEDDLKTIAARVSPCIVLYDPRSTALTIAEDNPNIPAEAKIQP